MPAYTMNALTTTGCTLSSTGRRNVLPVDHVVICAGQESCRDLESELRAAGVKLSLIGGADNRRRIGRKNAPSLKTRLATTF